MQLLTPAQCERRILKVCWDNYLRAGEHLSPQRLRIALLETNTLSAESTLAGLYWLVGMTLLLVLSGCASTVSRRQSPARLAIPVPAHPPSPGSSGLPPGMALGFTATPRPMARSITRMR